MAGNHTGVHEAPNCKLEEKTIQSLTNETTGTFRVTTVTASYLIDLDEMTMTRTPKDTEDLDRQLRRDSETVSLEEVAWIAVDYPMVLLVNLGIPGIDVTTRITTKVLSIVPERSDGALAQ